MDNIIYLSSDYQADLFSFEDKARPYAANPAKKTYTQNWSAYNQAQTKEKFMFLKILHEVIESIGIKNYGNRNGRPPFEIKDMIKCCVIKIFNDFSARRSIPDIELASLLHYIDKKPHFNSILNYMDNPYITQFLHQIIKLTSVPLAPFEKRFAADATGFSTFCKNKWLNVRLENKQHRDYKKLHAICGVHTNTIVSAKVTEGNAADSPQFKELLKAAATQFSIKEVSADAGYLSRENTQAIEDIGAVPYIMPKSNVSAKAKGHYPAWNRMIHLFQENESKFKIHYHQRSNIESTFSMIKRKFNPYIKSRHSKAQQNEILCKVICHNISVLISAVFELNLNIPYI